MAVGRFRFTGLRARLLLLVGLAMAPIIVLTVFNGVNERRNAIRLAQEYLQRLSDLAAANEAQSIERGRQLLQDVASAPTLLADQPVCRAMMVNLLNNHPDYNNFGLIQLNGDVTCSAVSSERMVNLADRPHFQRAVIERRFFASDYAFGRLTQRHAVNLSYPVFNPRKEVVAVVYASLDLASLDRFVRDIALPPGSVMLTADQHGTIISRRPDAQQWVSKAVSTEMRMAMAAGPGPVPVITGADGVARLHTFARVGAGDLTGYTLTIGIPRDGIVAAAQRDMWINLLGLLITGALALGCAWMLGETLFVRRIRALAQSAGRIAGAASDIRSGGAFASDEIGLLARSLDDVAMALQYKERDYQLAEQQMRAADKRKDEFLAMLAHELRNPLAPISTGAQLLKLACSDQPAVARTADVIARQVEHMTQLVDDLLDVSRVTRGLVTLNREPLDFDQLVEAAAAQAAPWFAQRRQRLTVRRYGAIAPVEGDRKRLLQVVAKLLQNAAQYTPEGGHVTVALADQPATRQWALSVADDGIGMAPEVVARVFDLFSRAERTPERAQGGLGLGLALVKSLVELHGGAVAAMSAGPGCGSCFTVLLPYAASANASPAGTRADAGVAAVILPAGRMPDSRESV